MIQRDGDRSDLLLLSFNMSNEILKEIMLPPHLRSVDENVAIINDSVALFLSDINIGMGDEGV